jgi:hypothetical protein
MKFSFESALYIDFVFCSSLGFSVLSDIWALSWLDLSLSRSFSRTLNLEPSLSTQFWLLVIVCVGVCVFWHGPQITTVCEIDTAESEGGDEDYQT